MWLFLLLSVFGVSIVGLLVAIFVGRARLDQKTAEMVDELLAASERPSQLIVQESDGGDLPPPVRRYLRHVLREEQPLVRAAQLQQSGTFRSGGAESPWRSFTATQAVTTRPPGFVWDASIEMMPGIAVRVVDAYHDGEGKLWAKLGGLLTVANPPPGPELDEGELLRYLAEAPLYPTALLPGRGVTWEPIDDRSARATLEDRGTTASLVFHFNERNEVERVTGERAFVTDEGTYEYRPWRGYWDEYEDRDGILVPVDGEVAWVHPEGEVSYWRGHLETIEYQTVPESAVENY